MKQCFLRENPCVMLRPILTFAKHGELFDVFQDMRFESSIEKCQITQACHFPREVDKTHWVAKC